MKGEDIALLIAGGIAAYMFMPEKVKEVAGGGGLGTYVTMPEITMPSISLDMLGGAREAAESITQGAPLDLSGWFEALIEQAKAVTPQIPTPNIIPEGITDPMGWLKEWWEANKPEMPELPEFPPKPEGEATPEPTPPAEVGTGQALREHAGAEFAGLTSWYGFSKLAPWFMKLIPKIAPKLGTAILPKAATALSGIGLPIAIAWTVADAITTGYEFITGKGVAGEWLGWGELLGFAAPPESKSKPEPERAGIMPELTGYEPVSDRVTGPAPEPPVIESAPKRPIEYVAPKPGLPPFAYIGG